MRTSQYVTGTRRPATGPTVLVASGGGHLQQLIALAPRMDLGTELIWAAPRSGLVDGLLKDRDYFELPYTMPRDWHAAIRLTRVAYHMLKECGATRVISTGASPAPPFFLAGARLGLELHYIESATRSSGPSLSGSLVELIPSTRLYTQFPVWAKGRWQFSGSILDPFATVDVTPTGPIRKVVVSLGTEGYSFRRAVERLLQVLPRDAEVIWQTGHTPVDGLGIEGRKSVPNDELRGHIESADVFVSHAGTGSALTAFELGKVPVILPREARHGEHVDDHQSLTSQELASRGLAVSVPVDELTADHLEQSRARRVIRTNTPSEFALQGGRSRTHVIDLRPGRGVRIARPEVAGMPEPRVATSEVRGGPIVLN